MFYKGICLAELKITSAMLAARESGKDWVQLPGLHSRGCTPEGSTVDV